MRQKLVSVLTAIFLITLVANGQETDPKQAMAQIKTNLEASMKNLRAYTWIETTTIFKGGEAKSQTQNQCYYSVDGKLTKVAVGAPASGDDKKARGIRGKVVENKKEEMSENVKKSVAKVHEYLPPQADKLQAIYASGKSNIQVLEPNKKYNLGFPDYLQAGDNLGLSLDMAKGLLLGISVNTYVDKPDNKINFKLTYAQLPDGTEYASETVLDLAAEGLKVVIKNDGYKK